LQKLFAQFLKAPHFGPASAIPTIAVSFDGHTVTFAQAIPFVIRHLTGLQDGGRQPRLMRLYKKYVNILLSIKL